MNDLVLYIAVVIILFVLVILNSSRTNKRARSRKKRSFRDNYFEKKKDTTYKE